MANIPSFPQRQQAIKHSSHAHGELPWVTPRLCSCLIGYEGEAETPTHFFGLLVGGGTLGNQRLEATCRAVTGMGRWPVSSVIHPEPGTPLLVLPNELNVVEDNIGNKWMFPRTFALFGFSIKTYKNISIYLRCIFHSSMSTELKQLNTGNCFSGGLL